MVQYSSFFRYLRLLILLGGTVPWSILRSVVMGIRFPPSIARGNEKPVPGWLWFTIHTCVDGDFLSNGVNGGMNDEWCTVSCETKSFAYQDVVRRRWSIGSHNRDETSGDRSGNDGKVDRLLMNDHHSVPPTVGLLSGHVPWSMSALPRRCTVDATQSISTFFTPRRAASHHRLLSPSVMTKRKATRHRLNRMKYVCVIFKWRRRLFLSVAATALTAEKALRFPFKVRVLLFEISILYRPWLLSRPPMVSTQIKISFRRSRAPLAELENPFYGAAHPSGSAIVLDL